MSDRCLRLLSEMTALLLNSFITISPDHFPQCRISSPRSTQLHPVYSPILFVCVEPICIER